MVFLQKNMMDLIFCHMARTLFFNITTVFPFLFSLNINLKNVLATLVQTLWGIFAFLGVGIDETFGVSKKLKWGADGL